MKYLHHNRNLILLVGNLFLASGCVSNSLESRAPVVLGPLESIHQANLGNRDDPAFWEKALGNRELFSEDAFETVEAQELSLERSLSGGAGSAFTLRLRRSGEAAYFGQAHSPRLGCYRGTISEYDFLSLAKVVEELGFFDLEESYYLYVTDSTSTYTSVVEPTRRKIVWNYAESGPAELWAIEELIEFFGEEVNWTKETGDISIEDCL